MDKLGRAHRTEHLSGVSARRSPADSALSISAVQTGLGADEGSQEALRLYQYSQVSYSLSQAVTDNATSSTV